MSQPIFVRESLDRTHLQVSMCLQAISTLGQFVCPGDYEEDFVSIPGHEAELEGGCPAAAGLAFMASCDRLTRLMQDDSRFVASAVEKGGLAEAIITAQTAATEASKAATAASRVMSAPHANLRPELVNTSEGWVAVYGDITKPNERVVGQGETAMEALLDFDLAMVTPTKAAK